MPAQSPLPAAPPAPFAVDWRAAPPGADYAACDHDGVGWWYSGEPAINYAGRCFEGRTLGRIGTFAPSPDWKTTKQRRPSAEMAAQDGDGEWEGQSAAAALGLVADAWGWLSQLPAKLRAWSRGADVSAGSGFRDCPVCSGSGVHPDGLTCPCCEGDGKFDIG